MMKPTRLHTALASAALLAGLLGPALARAAGEAGSAPLPETGLGGALMTMLAGLALVLGLMFGLYWLVRRFLPSVGGGAGGGMRLVGRLPLGPRKFVALVEVAGRVLVVGVSDRGVNLLTTIDDPSEVTAQRPAGEAQTFAGLFKRAATREDES